MGLNVEKALRQIRVLAGEDICGYRKIPLSTRYLDGHCSGCVAALGGGHCAMDEIHETAMRAAENYGDGGA